MKLMIASDLHGSLYYCRKMQDIYTQENAEKLILLGDLLYHGPRNDLPLEYNPKGVIEILNSMKNEILCVRGNCDCDVDQMVLEFPVLAEYMTMFYNGYMIFATHGHKFNNDNLPPMKKGDVLLNGHTHIYAMKDMGEYTYINAGSLSIPKNGNTSTYIILEDGVWYLKDLDGNIIQKHNK